MKKNTMPKKAFGNAVGCAFPQYFNFFFRINFFIFLDCFGMVMLKINFKK